MKYLSVFTHEPNPSPPSPELQAQMGALIQAGLKEGWLVTTEGISLDDTPMKVTRSKSGKVTVKDGPFTEAKEILGGYAIIEARDREHLLQLTQRFLEVAGAGTCEIHKLYV